MLLTTIKAIMAWAKRLVKQRLLWKSFLISIPVGFGTYFTQRYYEGGLTISPSAYSNVCLFISVFIAFRASQAYVRFWEGATALYRIRGNLFDVVSSLFAFSRCSKASYEEVENFRHMAVRLFSILETLLLADLAEENSGMRSHISSDFSVLDPTYLHEDTIRAIRQSEFPMELIIQWLQSMMVEAMNSGVIAVPPPVVSRVFHELQFAVEWFHVAKRITEVPIPFPYSFATYFVLAMNVVMLPLATANWSSYPSMCGLLAGIQCFALFALQFVSEEMEVPFGGDVNDLNLEAGHVEYNKKLWSMLTPAMQMMPMRRDNAELIKIDSQVSLPTAAGRTSTLRIIFDDSMKRSFSNLDSTKSRLLGRSLHELCEPTGRGFSPKSLDSVHEEHRGSAVSSQTSGRSSPISAHSVAIEAKSDAAEPRTAVEPRAAVAEVVISSTSSGTCSEDALQKAVPTECSDDSCSKKADGVRETADQLTEDADMLLI
eukprot:TRINITY_DN18093_c0_g1_i1.p1 TRINITY_DN18093_c0_g1~~TRINITY_DN18093_c0_g1_i1.p1  ORF type:complete len:487 (+),score=77.17 TRINITY_DN18093_c0_g1_i1:44-1504(+)